LVATDSPGVETNTNAVNQFKCLGEFQLHVVPIA